MKLIHILCLCVGFILQSHCMQLGVRAPLKNSTIFSNDLYSLDLVARDSDRTCTADGPSCGPTNCCKGELCCLDGGCCPSGTGCCPFACAPDGWKCCDNGFSAPSGGQCCDDGYACIGGSQCTQCDDGSGFHCCNPAQSSTLHIEMISIPTALYSSIEAKLSASGSIAPQYSTTPGLTGFTSPGSASSGLSGSTSSEASSTPVAFSSSSTFTPFSNSVSGEPKRFYTTYSYSYRINSTVVKTATELVITVDGTDAAQASFSMIEAGINQEISSFEASVSAAVHSTSTSSPVGPTTAASGSASTSPNGVSGRLSGSEAGSMWLFITTGFITGLLAIAL